MRTAPSKAGQGVDFKRRNNTKGKSLLAYVILELPHRAPRIAYAAIRNMEQGRNTLWYLWTAPNSPLYGRDKMTTFERYFLAEKRDLDRGEKTRITA